MKSDGVDGHIFAFLDSRLLLCFLCKYVYVFSPFEICISVVFEQYFVGRWSCRENWPPDQGAAYFPINAARIISTMCTLRPLCTLCTHFPAALLMIHLNVNIMNIMYGCVMFLVRMVHKYIFALYIHEYLYHNTKWLYLHVKRAKPIPRALLAHILHGKLIRWSETCIFCFCYHCIFCGMPGLWPVCTQANPAYIINKMHNGSHSQKLISFYYWKANIENLMWFPNETSPIHRFRR